MSKHEGVAPLTHDGTSGYSPPAAFGPFRVLHQVGIGVLGPVFRTYEPSRDRLVAVKALRLDLTPEQVRDVAADLQQVVELGLTHPSLLSVIGAGVEGAIPYVAMEYAAAESLDVAVKHYAPAALDRVLPFVTQLAGAIDLASTAKVRHGALHPRDIFVTPDLARAGGFGIAQAIERVGARCPVRRPYSPPERIDGGTWSTRADVFSLAAIAFELLTGRRVAGTGEESAAMLEDVDIEPRATLVNVFATGLAEDPGARYPTARSFAEALASAARGEAVPVKSKRDVPKRVGKSTPVPTSDAPSRVAAEPASSQEEQRGLDAVSQDPGRDVPASGEHDSRGVSRRTSEPSLFDPADDDAAPNDAAAVDAYDDAAADDEPALELSLAAKRARTADPEAVQRYAETFQPDIEPFQLGAEALRQDDKVSSLLADFEPAVPEMPATELVAGVDRGKSAMIPIAVGAMVGVLIGFAVGYGLGSREPAASGVPAEASAIVATPEAADQAADQSEAGESRLEVETTERPASVDVGTEALVLVPAPAAAPPPAVGGSGAPLFTEPAPGVGGQSVTRTAATPPARATGRLLVRSTPAGATVSVEGRERGTTPLALRGLPYGTYSVSVVRLGYQPSVESVSVTSDHPAGSLTFELQPVETASAASSSGATGSVYVLSRPAGARVFVGGRLVGTTPLLLSDLRPGSHRIRLERAGYGRWDSTVEIAAGRRSRVSASLEAGQ